MLGAACRGERPPEAEPVVQYRSDWEAVTDSLPPDPEAQAGILESYRQRHGLPMLFHAGEDTAAVSRLAIVVREDACGTLVPAFRKDIPQEHAALATRFVLEVDSAGNALQRWEVPVDVVVVGVSGADVLVSPGRRPTDVYFRIAPDGNFEVEAGRMGTSPVSIWPQGTCPNRPDLMNLQCEEFRDDGRRRMLLHSPPCD